MIIELQDAFETQDSLKIALFLRKIEHDPNSYYVRTRESILNELVRFGDINLVEKFIGLGADVNQSGTRSYTPLITAVCLKQLDMVKALIKAGADIHIVEYLAQTPLHHAIGVHSDEIIDLLLSYGANPYISDRQGIDCFILAEEIYGHTQMLRQNKIKACTKAKYRLDSWLKRV